MILLGDFSGTFRPFRDFFETPAWEDFLVQWRLFRGFRPGGLQDCRRWPVGTLTVRHEEISLLFGGPSSPSRKRSKSQKGSTCGRAKHGRFVILRFPLQCLVAHPCGDPNRATQCRAQSVASNSRQRCRAKIALHPPKSRCRTFLRTPLSHFPLIRSRRGARRAGGGYCGTLGFRKRIALQGGIAATVTPVALLCATKLQRLGVLRYLDAGKNSTKNVIVAPLFVCAPQMLVELGLQSSVPIC